MGCAEDAPKTRAGTARNASASATTTKLVGTAELATLILATMERTVSATMVSMAMLISATSVTRPVENAVALENGNASLVRMLAMISKMAVAAEMTNAPLASTKKRRIVPVSLAHPTVPPARQRAFVRLALKASNCNN